MTEVCLLKTTQCGLQLKVFPSNCPSTNSSCETRAVGRVRQSLLGFLLTFKRGICVFSYHPTLSTTVGSKNIFKYLDLHISKQMKYDFNHSLKPQTGRDISGYAFRSAEDLAAPPHRRLFGADWKWFYLLETIHHEENHDFAQWLMLGHLSRMAQEGKGQCRAGSRHRRGGEAALVGQNGAKSGARMEFDERTGGKRKISPFWKSKLLNCSHFDSNCLSFLFFFFPLWGTWIASSLGIKEVH